tara:strand:- start:501 stop:722 length:222 start_codon:yes stop_codon:yes gene_type:complete
MPHSYKKIKSFNLFKNPKEPGSKKPDYSNGKVILDLPMDAGRYSFSGWRYEDTGNISLEIQKVTEGERDPFDD